MNEAIFIVSISHVVLLVSAQYVPQDVLRGLVLSDTKVPAEVTGNNIVAQHSLSDDTDMRTENGNEDKLNKRLNDTNDKKINQYIDKIDELSTDKLLSFGNRKETADSYENHDYDYHMVETIFDGGQKRKPPTPNTQTRTSEGDSNEDTALESIERDSDDRLDSVFNDNDDVTVYGPARSNANHNIYGPRSYGYEDAFGPERTRINHNVYGPVRFYGYENAFEHKRSRNKDNVYEPVRYYDYENSFGLERSHINDNFYAPVRSYGYEYAFGPERSHSNNNVYAPVRSYGNQNTFGPVRSRNNQFNKVNGPERSHINENVNGPVDSPPQFESYGPHPSRVSKKIYKPVGSHVNVNGPVRNYEIVKRPVYTPYNYVLTKPSDSNNPRSKTNQGKISNYMNYRDHKKQLNNKKHLNEKKNKFVKVSITKWNKLNQEKRELLQAVYSLLTKLEDAYSTD